MDRILPVFKSVNQVNVSIFQEPIKTLHNAHKIQVFMKNSPGQELKTLISRKEELVALQQEFHLFFQGEVFHGVPFGLAYRQIGGGKSIAQGRLQHLVLPQGSN